MLNRSASGRTRSRYIPTLEVGATKAQIADCEDLPCLFAGPIAASDGLCQFRLQKGTGAEGELPVSRNPTLVLEVEVPHRRNAQLSRDSVRARDNSGEP